jgi:hypothetical protein
MGTDVTTDVTQLETGGTVYAQRKLHTTFLIILIYIQKLN